MARVNEGPKFRTVLLISLLCGASSSAYGQQFTPDQPTVTLRTNVKLVLSHTRVTDATSRPVLNLKKDDFRVFESGREQEIGLFMPIETPVHVALVMDTSGSTVFHLSTLKEAAQRFVDKFGAGDQFALYSVSHEVVRVLGFTQEPKNIKRAIGRMETAIGPTPARKPKDGQVIRAATNRGGTLLYDGLLAVRDEFPPDAQRRVILVFTDGWENGSSASFDSLNWLTLQGSEILYVVMPKQDLIWNASTWLRRLAPTANKKKPAEESEEPADGAWSDATWGLILDLSGVSSEGVDTFQAVARKFLSQLKPEAHVWLFDYQARLRPLVFPPEEGVPAQARSVSPGDAARLLAMAGSDETPLERARVKVSLDKVLVLTDRKNTGLKSLEQVLGVSALSLAVLHPEELTDPAELEGVVRILVQDKRGVEKVAASHILGLLLQMEGQLRRLARDTGGTAFEIKKAGDLGKTYEQIATQIRTSYLLGYYTQARPGRHTVEVKVPNRDLVVYARQAVVVW